MKSYEEKQGEFETNNVLIILEHNSNPFRRIAEKHNNKEVLFSPEGGALQKRHPYSHLPASKAFALFCRKTPNL